MSQDLQAEKPRNVVGHLGKKAEKAAEFLGRRKSKEKPSKPLPRRAEEEVDVERGKELVRKELINIQSDEKPLIQTIVPEFNTREAVQLIERLDGERVAPEIQMAVLLSEKNFFTGGSISNIDQRATYARQISERYFSQDADGKMIASRVHQLLHRDEKVNVFNEYLKSRYQLTDKQFQNILKSQEKTHLDSISLNRSISKDLVEIFKNPVFEKDAQATNKWAYHGKVKFPDAQGEMAEYEIIKEQFPRANLVYLLNPKTGTRFHVEKGYVDEFNKPALSDKAYTVLRRVSELPKEAEMAGELSLIMLLQLGAIHPARVNGRWCWVVEPRADIKIDPKQEGYANQGGNYFYKDNKYSRWFLERKKQVEARGQKLKVIDVEDTCIPGGLHYDEPPYVYVQGTELQYLSHHRVKGAQEVGLPIVVKFSDIKTFN